MTAAEAGVVGAGRIGLSLAAALEDTGRFDRVWVAGRRAERPAFLRDRDGVGYGVRDGWTRELPTRPAERLTLFFCVPDRSIGEAAEAWGRELARAGMLAGGSPGPTLHAVFHTSGSRPASDLEPLAREAEDHEPGLAALHPLCAVAGPDPEAFRDVTFGVEGTRAGVEAAREVAEAVGRRAIRVPAEGKARYHAGAVFASNLLAACIGAGLRQLRSVSPDEVGADDLLPLARSALEQIDRHGLAAGTTGPVVRGDVATVESHLEALDPAARSVYASLTAELLTHADVPPDVRRAVEDALSDG
ncbi:MAG: DUF2520 domain-containing protein [Gemmatimonadota bacterium]